MTFGRCLKADRTGSQLLPESNTWIALTVEHTTRFDSHMYTIAALLAMLEYDQNPSFIESYCKFSEPLGQVN